MDLFAKGTKIIYYRNPIDEIKPFKYVADGDNTALYDCLGDRINCIKKKHIEEGSPTKTLFVIMTDGYDNFSKNYSVENIRTLVEERRNAGWEFIYLGAMLSEAMVKNEASKIGIPISQSQLYLKESVENNFKAIENVVKDLREHGKIKPDWSNIIKKTLSPNLTIEGDSENYLRLERK